MPIACKVFEVLVAGPNDVGRERDTLFSVIEDWNAANFRTRRVLLKPLRWELDSRPALGTRPQELLNNQIVNHADMMLAVFGARLGTPTGHSVSGTVEEIERFRSQGKPALIYFSQGAIPRDHDPAQLQDLEHFRKEMQTRDLYGSFKGIASLRSLVARNLNAALNELLYRMPPTDGIGVIKAPTSGSEAKVGLTVAGRLDFVEPGAYPWLIVEVHNKIVYPQCHLDIGTIDWEHEVRIGRPGKGLDTGLEYKVHLVLVDKETDHRFYEYVIGKSPMSDGFAGGWPSSMRLLDTVSVIRID